MKGLKANTMNRNSDVEIWKDKENYSTTLQCGNIQVSRIFLLKCGVMLAEYS